MSRYYSKDPYEIRAKFDSKCHETGKDIKKGDTCIYYPIGKKVFHTDSKQAQTYRETQFDYDLGYNY